MSVVTRSVRSRPPARRFPEWHAGSLLTALLVLPTAQAQEPAASAVQEVVVTAQKRTESVSSVPLSVTVIDDRTIERASISGFTDYAMKAPNLSFSYTQGQGTTTSRSISVRGIQGGGTTGFYIDDLPLPAGVDPHALGLARIEILRGPQGTLYGARSMGGTVRLITQAPDPSRSSGTAYASGSSLTNGGQGYEVQGGINLPLAEDVAVRASVFSLTDGGFLDRRFPGPAGSGEMTARNIARRDEYGASASLQWDVSDSFRVRTLLMHQRSRSNGLPLADIAADNQVQQRLFDIPESMTDEWTIAGLTLNWRTAFGDLTSASSYFDREAYEFEEASDWTASVLGYSPPLPTGMPTWLPQHQFVQEVRFASSFGGPVQLVAGLYYADLTAGFRQHWVIPGLAEVNGAAYGTDLAYITNNPGMGRDKAVFGEVTYSFNERWSAIAGVRYSDSRQSSTRVADGVFNGGPSAERLSASETSTTPKLGIKYQPTPDANFYAVASQGFRPGGPNGELPDVCAADLAALGLTFDDVRSVSADSVWNYELGGKFRFPERRASLDTAIFWIDWSDIQQGVRLPTCGFSYAGNAGSARSRGAELEFSILPVEGLSISGGVGYTDAQITGASPNVSVRPGQPIQQVAPWTVSSSVEYEFPLNGGLRGLTRADYSYVDHSYSASNDQLHPRLREPYGILNLRAGISRDSWDVALFVKNATNDRPNLGDNQSQAAELAGRPRILTILPRTIGIDARLSF